ncbi:nucleotidyl transferase AbiEii/AbiGii toxin family protein [Bradyrhizobium sp. ma5]|uniref:nucleotidyl transferase AbiEii/AbiGii toxin family protein n=1 Tax=Bradyrhizobium sp. ma5 TaxID=3344828 RepID=UPI0035D5165D
MIDVVFGDAVEPGVQEIDLPVLLDFPPPKLRSYARETVVAEKFQAMVSLGLANSRLKDFYDVWLLIRSYKFEGDALARAIKATFERRKTEIPTKRPDGLTTAFTEDAGKKDQWSAFTKQVAVEPGSLTEVSNAIRGFYRGSPYGKPLAGWRKGPDLPTRQQSLLDRLLRKFDAAANMDCWLVD